MNTQSNRLYLQHHLQQPPFASQQPATSYRWRYTLYGALFGVVFPVLAVILRLAQYGSQRVQELLLSDPLLWIIMTAPLFLGLFASFAGAREDSLREALASLAAEQTATQRKVDEAVAIIRAQEAEARLRDVEARQFAEEARKTAETAQKVQTEFLANMSHELRTPLVAVLGFIEIVREQAIGDDAKRYLDIALRSGRALSGIINDLLDFVQLEAHQQPIEAEPTTIRRVIEESLNIFAAQAQEAGLEVSALVEPSVPPMLVLNQRRVRQVLYNLVGNAVKFTPQGWVRLEASYSEGILKLVIQDSGIGIAPEFRERIFDQFLQQDGSSTRKFGGTGLGLALVQRIVHAMSGTISCHSTLGQGSTFTVMLPSNSAMPE
jgi:signal transduction histidine kinase